MNVRIRFQPKGKPGQRSRWIIVVDSRQKRDTEDYLEKAGNYNPHTKEAKLDKKVIQKWIKNGAQPTLSVANLIKKHLGPLEDLKNNSKDSNP